MRRKDEIIGSLLSEYAMGKKKQDVHSKYYAPASNFERSLGYPTNISL
jgi:hypothetical protein